MAPDSCSSPTHRTTSPRRGSSVTGDADDAIAGAAPPSTLCSFVALLMIASVRVSSWSCDSRLSCERASGTFAFVTGRRWSVRREQRRRHMHGRAAAVQAAEPAGEEGHNRTTRSQRARRATCEQVGRVTGEAVERIMRVCPRCPHSPTVAVASSSPSLPRRLVASPLVTQCCRPSRPPPSDGRSSWSDAASMYSR